jgi:hypothetical protein
MVERLSHCGWDNTYRLSDDLVELFVTANLGPCIIRYGFEDPDNLLHEAGEAVGKSSGPEFRLYGGHLLWVSPEVERTYYPDNGPVNVAVSGNAVRFTAEQEDSPPGMHLQKESGSRFGGFRLTRSNYTPHRESRVVADNSRALVTDDDGSRRPSRPAAPLRALRWTRTIPCRWEPSVYGRSPILPTRAGLRHVIHPVATIRKSRGAASRNKIGGIFNSAGWGTHRASIFSSSAFRCIAGAKYPDFGCNFQVFTNPEFLELGTLGPVVELRPGRECRTH